MDGSRSAGIRYMTADGGSLLRGQHGDGASHVLDGKIRVARQDRAVKLRIPRP